MTKRTVWLVVLMALMAALAVLCVLRALRGNDLSGGGVHFIRWGQTL